MPILILGETRLYVKFETVAHFQNGQNSLETLLYVKSGICPFSKWAKLLINFLILKNQEFAHFENGQNSLET